MQVQLSGQQIEITQALRGHVQGKIDRLTRLDARLNNLAVVLSMDRLQQCAEGTLSVPGAILHAEAAAADMYASIDTVFDKLVVQLRKHREKVCDKRQREAREDRLERSLN